MRAFDPHRLRIIVLVELTVLFVAALVFTTLYVTAGRRIDAAVEDTLQRTLNEVIRLCEVQLAEYDRLATALCADTDLYRLKRWSLMSPEERIHLYFLVQNRFTREKYVRYWIGAIYVHFIEEDLVVADGMALFPDCA